MQRIAKLVCPHCGIRLKTSPDMPAGKKVRCSYCSGRFRVAPENDKTSPSAGDPGQPRLNMKRLSVAVLGVGLYLVVGGALAFDCFMRADPSYRSVWNGTTPPNDQPPPPIPAKLPVITVPVSDEEQQKIDAAIVKGVWYLRKTVKDGGWGTNLPANSDPVAVAANRGSWPVRLHKPYSNPSSRLVSDIRAASFQ
jgi:hypothetical protein